MFRPAVKEYIKCRLATSVTVATLHRCAYCLSNFLIFFLQQYPHAQTLQALSKQDIDTFLLALRAEAQARGWKNNQRIRHHISDLEDWLCHLERTQSPLRPNEPTTRIIWPSHYPRHQYQPRAHAKDIPKTVLDQLDAHLQYLPAPYIPIVVVLRASGWRISDVLFLKLDTCLEQDGENYWLVGDIQKTQVLTHKIPITKEVAAVILAQIAWVEQHYTREENPKRWLFPALKSRGGRTNQPIRINLRERG
ncbi:MAG TPA: hypothetical protein VHV10_10540 [Ktedonobacteraceae bacterium]|nr:hypothetical protein [Ktedonobacteraceae bacterium]